jgi:hypothetical protein
MTIFSFQYTSSNDYSEEVIGNDVYCAHINIEFITSFNEANGRIIMKDNSWFVLTQESGESLSELFNH